VPTQRWLTIWIVVIMISASTVVGLELMLRARDYEPSLKDDVYAWAWERTRASNDDPHTLAVLGSSRMQLPFAMDAFHDALPGWTAIQLAINATWPVGSLRDLAADPHFVGVALVDISEIGLMERMWSGQDEYVEAYRRRWRAPGAMAERWLATKVQSHLALISAGGMRMLAKLWQDHEIPPPRYVVTHADRTRFADYSRADVKTRELWTPDRPPPTQAELDAWLAEALGQERYVEAIQARGGKVVFLRMPTCGERWLNDEKNKPKALYWDRFAAKTKGIAIHFMDEPTLQNYECPDLSHLASREGPRFTRALIDVMVRRGAVAR
jgi:hypothetical protein